MKKQSLLSILSVIGLCTGFVFTILCSLTYMAKDYNTYNTVYAFFGVSTNLRIALTQLHVSKLLLLRLLNCSHVLFVFSSLAYALLFAMPFSHRTSRRILSAALVPVLVQLVLLDPQLVAWFYLSGIGPFQDIYLFQAVYDVLPTVLRWISITLCLFSAVVLAVTFFRTPHALRGGMGLIVLFFSGILTVYLYLFSWLPVQALWLSRVAHYVRYKSLPVYAPTPFNTYVPLISCLFVVSLCLITLHYLRSSSASRRSDIAFHSKVSAVDIMSRVFCHYLKNELLSQQAELNLLMNQVDPALKPDVSYIISRNNEIYQRLSSIRDAMKQEKQAPERIDLCHIIDEIFRSIPLLDDVQLDVLLPPHSMWVMSNPYQLREAIECLVRNAQEAPVVDSRLRRLRVSVEPMHRYVSVTIANNGPRIDRRQRETIFDPFVSTKPSKSNWGLGLSLCRSIVALYHGRIWVDECSIEGEILTCFHVALPLTD